MHEHMREGGALGFILCTLMNGELCHANLSIVLHGGALGVYSAWYTAILHDECAHALQVFGTSGIPFGYPTVANILF